jgi:hypothetical protein
MCQSTAIGKPIFYCSEAEPGRMDEMTSCVSISQKQLISSLFITGENSAKNQIKNAEMLK